MLIIFDNNSNMFHNNSNIFDHNSDLPQTSLGPSGLPGHLVVLDSRMELDCLVDFINDEFDHPATDRYTMEIIIHHTDSLELTV